MDRFDIARFMQLNGAISGGRRDGPRWMILPGRRVWLGRLRDGWGSLFGAHFARAQGVHRTDKSHA